MFAARVAVPLPVAGWYVLAAYLVFAALIAIYIGIMARKTYVRQRQLVQFRRQLEAAAPPVDAPPDDRPGATAQRQG